MLDLINPWADLLISLSNLVLASAVVPTIWAGRKHQHVPYATSVTFVVTLAVLAVALLSVGLVVSFITDVGAVGLWGIVGGQRAWQGRRGSGNRHTKSS